METDNLRRSIAKTLGVEDDNVHVTVTVHGNTLEMRVIVNTESRVEHR